MFSFGTGCPAANGFDIGRSIGGSFIVDVDVDVGSSLGVKVCFGVDVGGGFCVHKGFTATGYFGKVGSFSKVGRLGGGPGIDTRTGS